MIIKRRAMPPGTRVYHVKQEFAVALPKGTGAITGVEGPFADGSYEYTVKTGRDFSKPTGRHNPEISLVRWSSFATHIASGQRPTDTERQT